MDGLDPEWMKHSMSGSIHVCMVVIFKFCLLFTSSSNRRSALVSVVLCVNRFNFICPVSILALFFICNFGIKVREDDVAFS